MSILPIAIDLSFIFNFCLEHDIWQLQIE